MNVAMDMIYSVLTVQQRKWIVKFVVLVFVVLCANTLRHTGEPRSFHLQVANGVVASFMLNAALILSFFVVRRWARYLLAAALVPTALGVTFVMTDYGLVAAVLALAFHVWLIADLVRIARPI